MKTEVFVGNPHLKAGILSPPKAVSEHLVSILLLDTPQNTPVGSPQSNDDTDLVPSTSTATFEANAEIRNAEKADPVCIPKKKKKNKKRPKYAVDEVFSDTYEMSSTILGSGAYATVNVCTDKKTKEEYAVKVILKDLPFHTRKRVFRELETLHICRHHSNVVKLVNFFDESDRYLMVFEKAAGGPLLHHIEKLGSFTEKAASFIIRDLADALSFLHKKGIAHRDLKPENILCVEEDQPFPVKICDFDLATSVVYERRTSTPLSSPELRSPVGSPEFMAPEIVEGFIGKANTYDKRCDLWSLGVIMYILLCGYPPFHGECGKACGWQIGLSCDDCRANLFNSIREGIFTFPPADWSDISYGAKELISKLLVIDASRRYSAEMVLKHPWVADGGPTNLLETPCVIKKNESAKSLSGFMKSINEIHRKENPDTLESTDDTVSSMCSSLQDSSFERSFSIMDLASGSPHSCESEKNVQ